MDASNQESGPELAKGQLWKTTDAYVRIVDQGNRVVHYKVMANPTQSAATRLIRRDALAVYLKANHAALLN